MPSKKKKKPEAQLAVRPASSSKSQHDFLDEDERKAQKALDGLSELALQSLNIVEINLEAFGSRNQIQQFRKKINALHLRETKAAEMQRSSNGGQILDNPEVAEGAVRLCFKILNHHCQFVGEEYKQLRLDAECLKQMTSSKLANISGSLHEDHERLTVQYQTIQAQHAELTAQNDKFMRELHSKDVLLAQKDVDLIEARLLLQNSVQNETVSREKSLRNTHVQEEELKILHQTVNDLNESLNRNQASHLAREKELEAHVLAVRIHQTNPKQPP